MIGKHANYILKFEIEKIFMYLWNFIEDNNGGKYLKVKVVPNSSELKIVWKMDDWRVKIKLKQPAHGGKANKELIEFISKKLWIPKSQITFVGPSHSRGKLLNIDF